MHSITDRDLGTPAADSSKTVSLEIDGIRVEVPEGTEHSFTPPAVRPPKVASLQTKLPTRTL